MKNLTLDNFNFDLPTKYIAQYPLKNRDDSKLLVVNQTSFLDHNFKDLPSLINPNDLLVFNDTKVIPTKLLAKNKNDTIFNITLYKQLSPSNWLAFIKNSRRLKINQTLYVTKSLQITIINKSLNGDVEVKLVAENPLLEIEKNGLMPLPPYIKRDYNNLNIKEDKNRYQTIFAKNLGSVASPTASLHFTDTIMEKIHKKQIKTTFLTLHVGAGTFLPVKTEKIKEHKMHTEYGILPISTINAINTCKKNKGRVIAVGTTSLRTLEYAYQQGNRTTEFAGEIDLFIYPPYNFKIADCLITNFHLPKSTLFMLVCAFSGIKRIQNAYNHAKINNYRFFSYGDSCFLNKLSE